MLAQSYKGIGINTQAYRYYFKSRDERQIVECLKEVGKEVYPTEMDLLYARACIDMILRSPETQKTRYILDEGKKVCGDKPLFTFIHFLIEALILEEFDLIKKMALEDFAKELARDDTFADKIDKIC